MKNLTTINHIKIYDLFKVFSAAEENLILQGEMSDELTIPIIDYSSLVHDSSDVSQKKLSFFIAESFQNIIRHGLAEDSNQKTKNGTYGITRYKKIVTLHSSNLISEDEVDLLDNRLIGLNSLSPEELRESYVSVLKDTELSEKGGAGLGLIEMVRKSKGGIKHYLERNPLNNYFHFDVSLNAQTGIEQPFQSSVIHEMMKRNAITFLIKTRFNHQKFIHLNEILNRKIIDTQANQTNYIRKLNYVFIELIQNIYKHAYGHSSDGREGVFLISDTQNGTKFYSGNFISTTEANGLKESLENLNRLTEEELNELYKRTLLKNINFDPNVSAGLGLIEMKRMTPYPFEFSITPIDESKAFFTNSIILKN